MDYHAIHGHDVANFGTPGRHETRRVLTVSAADVDDALLSPVKDEAAAAAAAAGGIKSAKAGEEERTPATRCFVSTGLPTLDGILAGVPLPTVASDSEDGEDDADLDDGEAARFGSQQSRKRRRTPPAQRNSRASVAGGVRRGQLTEIWGPPGTGKTTFGMQLVANAVRDGGRAVWIDCSSPLCPARLSAVVEAQQQQQTPPAAEPSATTTDTPDNAAAPAIPSDAFVRYVCPSLPHWIALLCAPPAASTPHHPPWLPPGTTLLVIDALSALVNYALPRTAEGKVPLMANGKRGPTLYEKRTQVLQYITAALERLAETCHLAVVVLTQCASRVGGGPGRNNAGLAPAINAVVWDRAIAARLVLFRDWAWVEEEDDDDDDEKGGKRSTENTKKKRTAGGSTGSRRPVGGRFAGVQKVGRSGSGFGGADNNGFGNDMQTPGGNSSSVEHVVGFGIRETGLFEVPYSTQPPRGAGDGKRRRGGGGGDDDDSDYGWDDDDSMPKMPPQWQGSEDLLLGRVYGEDEEEEEDEETEEKEEDDAGEATPARGVLDGAVDSSGRLGILRDAWPPHQPARRRGPQSVADSEDDSDF